MIKVNIFISLVFILVCRVCTSYGSTCQFSNKIEESTTILKRLDEVKDRTFITNDGKFTYKFQLCGNPVGTCPNSQNSSIVETSDADCVVIGNFNEASISASDDWISVSYRGNLISGLNGSTTLFRDSVVTFVCDPNYKQETFTLAHVTNCMGSRLHYTFIIVSSTVCVKGGLSGGSVFCILFFTFIGAYLLFGFLYRRLILKAKGFEQIPNYESWKEFGNLVADGCDYLCRCNNRNSNKLYQGIDDSFSNPNENLAEGGDDHLLPM